MVFLPGRNVLLFERIVDRNKNRGGAPFSAFLILPGCKRNLDTAPAWRLVSADNGELPFKQLNRGTDRGVSLLLPDRIDNGLIAAG